MAEVPVRESRSRAKKRTGKRRHHGPKHPSPKHSPKPGPARQKTPTPPITATTAVAIAGPLAPPDTPAAGAAQAIARAPAQTAVTVEAVAAMEPVVPSSPLPKAAPPSAEPPPAVQEARASIKAAEPVRSRAPLVGLVLAVLAAGTLFALRNKTARPPEPPPAASAPASAAAPPPGPTVPPRFAEPLDVSTFQKGNIHTHTSKSDGDSAPEVVYGWYKSHGYNFLAVTDHNTFTNPKNFGYLEKKGSFVLISGEEITMMGANHQVHVNGLCTHKAIGGKHFDTQGAALAWAVAEVRAQGGVSLVNHPNWDWALTEKDIPSARGASLLEISSGHPFVRTDGDETHKSHEAIWDHALSHGEVLAGAAVDDSHYFKPYVKKKEDEPKARPGRAWVEVFAEVPERDRICEALGKGRLYASTGVKLKRITVDATTYTLAIEDKDAEVTFVGREGRVLQKGKAGDDGKASYTLRGGEGYVRAKVVTPDGAAAWTQPSFLAQETPEKEGPPALLKPEEMAPVKPGASATPLLPGH